MSGTMIDISQRYIPMFLAGFADADIVGTCQRIDDPHVLAWDRVHVSNVKALGCATIAYDPDEDPIKLHIHVSPRAERALRRAHQSPAGRHSTAPHRDAARGGQLADDATT